MKAKYLFLSMLLALLLIVSSGCNGVQEGVPEVLWRYRSASGIALTYGLSDFEIKEAETLHPLVSFVSTECRRMEEYTLCE